MKINEIKLTISDYWQGEHVKIEHQKFYSYKGVNTNSIESFWAIIKRGVMGQYHHISPARLPEYIAEFVFKYNNRKEDTMFITLVRNTMKIESL
ncbi:MAG: transposase [Bacteroidia bacterium]